MALRGNLRDFSLPDVFQLITFSRKTGVLRIQRSDDAQGAVWFRDGDVFFASSNWHTELLGERLVKAQRITEQALQRALSLRAAESEGGRRLGEILVDEGYISEQVLETFVTEQIQDTIFDLMRWDEGEFDFEPMPELADEDIGLSVSMENVVMEGSRRLEEWNRIRKKIPSMDVVFKMATAPGEGTFEISLKPLEWQLLLLVDGSRSVADLARDTDRTDFEVARVVYGLFSAGLLEFATEEEIQKSRDERTEREARLGKALAQREAALRAKGAAPQPEAAIEPAETSGPVADTAVGDVLAETAGSDLETGAAPAEEPQFLGADAAASPTDDDEAALAAFMGAVLGTQAAEPEESAAAAVEPSVPYVPADEPAFFTSPAQADTSGIAVPSVEELLGIEAVPSLETGEADAGATAAVHAESSGDLEVADSTVEQPVGFDESAEAPPEQSKVVDFEHDLIALGLGELPSDLLEPITATPAEEPSLGESSAEVSPETAAHGVAETESAELHPDGSVLPWGGAGDEAPLEPVAEPMSVIGQSAEPTDDGSEPDFSELLQSLDIDAQVEETPQAVEPEGFDAELLIPHEQATEGAVISTDAYLEDIKMTGLGFTGGLTDELSALTGAQRRQPARPQANVRALPDETTHVLSRDDRVDRETLLKIIDGIKGL